MSDLIQLGSLPVETLAEMANEAAAACEASGRKTVEHAATCGRALLAIRPQIPHGEWLDWLEANFRQSRQRAQQFMEIANCYRGSNLEEATTIRQALRLIADSPEKQAKKQERETKKQERQAEKAEVPPKPVAAPVPAPPVAVSTIRQESPTTPQRQPEKPAWLADPDELDDSQNQLSPNCPDNCTEPPPLPRTNTHHTPANRRTPDARETDRAGLATAEEPYRHGAWYEWSEPRQRMIPLNDYEICCRAEEISPPPPELPAVLTRHNADDILRVMLETRDARREKPEQVLRMLKKIVDELQEPAKTTKRFTKPTPQQVTAYAAEIGALVDGQQFCDFYESKDWMIGKNKMKDWQAAVRTWSRSGKKPSPAQLRTQAAGTEDFGISYEVVE